MEVREAQTQAELDEALALRERVFCGEQGVTPAADRDGRDGEATHLVAVEDGRVIGTCRLLPRGRVMRLGRLAVEPDQRGRGIASKILVVADDLARAHGARRIDLHAQTYAIDLYLADGYVVSGERFVEEGIEHVSMEKELDA
ncbi:MAG: GNAT family N-acetyltransferase [Thermoleophilaceae bacterium]